MNHRVVTICAVTLAMPLPVSAQVDRQEQQQAQAAARESQPPDLEQADENIKDRPTAEELLKALQRSRPINEPIPPAGAPGDRSRAEAGELFPEGFAVVDKSGRLAEDGVWRTFVFDPAEGTPPVKLLPNACLEVMVRTVTGARSPINFIISGEMTVFEGENYLIARVARRSIGIDRPDAQASQINGEANASGEEVSPGSRQTHDAGGAGEVPSADLPVEDVLAAMRRQQPGDEVIPLVAPGSEDLPAHGGTAARTLIPDGSPLVHRCGRVVRDGPWWTFVFESDHPNHQEPPMALLPNQSVELMLRVLEREQRGVLFLVSGEVMAFMGRNFLLPRIAMLRSDSGNLRK